MSGKLEQAKVIVDSITSMQDTSRSEASLFERTRDLREADRLLDKYAQGYPNDPDAMVLHARVASLLKDWDLSIVRWSRVLHEVPAYRDEAYYHLNISYRNAGSLHRARAALDKIRTRPLLKKVERERSRLEHLEAETAARVVGNRLVEALTNDPRADITEPLLESLFLLRGDEQETERCIRSVTSSIRANRQSATRSMLRRWRGGNTVLPGIEPRNSVFFCGFGWSGSGALYDYFRQSDGATEPFGKVEMLVMHGDWSIQRLLDEARTEPERARRALLNFIYQSVLGTCGRMSLEPTLSRNKSLIRAFEGDAKLIRALTEACLELVKHGMEAAAAGSESGLEDALRRFLDRIISAKVQPDGIGLVNNVIHPQNVGLVRLVSNAKVLAVFRDPRDQYVSRIYESRDGRHLTCDQFIHELRSKYEAYELGVEPVRSSVEEVQFEEFVLSSVTRASVAERIGLSLPKKGMGYQPEDSRPNIGVHRSYPKTSEIAKIEQAFRTRLFGAPTTGSTGEGGVA